MDKILNEIKAAVSKNFPDSIEKIIFYGSRNRGDSNNYSDYDILLITKIPADFSFKNEVYTKLNDIDIENEVLIDYKFIAKDELTTLKGRQPFIVNALSEGVYI